MLEDGSGEGLQLNGGVLSAVQRFLPVLEDFFHQREDRTADDHIYVALLLVLIPPILDVPVNGTVYIQEVLEFIEYQCELLSFPLFHKESKYIAEDTHRGNEYARLVLELFAEFLAQNRFRFLADKKIHVWLILKCFFDKRGFADTASACDYRKTRIPFIRELPHLVQRFQLLFPVIKLHMIQNFTVVNFTAVAKLIKKWESATICPYPESLLQGHSKDIDRAANVGNDKVL